MLGFWREVKLSELRDLRLPKDRFRLEEINLPAGIAQSLAGRTVTVRILPQEEAGTRRVEPPYDYSVLIDKEGNCWNDWHPLRIIYTDGDGQLWNLPRRWLPEFQTKIEPFLEPSYRALQEASFQEVLQLPTDWDLREANVPPDEAEKAYRQACLATVEVRISPGQPAEVFWQSPNGTVWRLPHDWRKRVIQLPDFGTLVSQQIPADVAKEYSGKIISVNYHPGSLCCLQEQYRFRDRERHRWPVRIQDCLVLGYGEVRPSA